MSAWTLLLAAGDSTETDEDNGDVNEFFCVEGGKTSTKVANVNQKEEPKALNNRRNKLIGQREAPRQRDDVM